MIRSEKAESLAYICKYLKFVEDNRHIQPNFKYKTLQKKILQMGPMGEFQPHDAEISNLEI